MQQKKINLAVMGFGNVSKGAIQAIESAPDMNFLGVIEEREYWRNLYMEEAPQIRFFKSLAELKTVDVDVVILGIITGIVKEKGLEFLKMGINTVDSFDIHGQELLNLKKEFGQKAKENGAISVSAAGWDPGTDSVIRVLLEMMAPRGITDTNFGPGISLGHSAAVKYLPGVKDAISITIPKGSGLHRRQVYLELEDKTDFEKIKEKILQDPYFVNDETHIQLVDNVQGLVDMGHGVKIVRKGVAGTTHNQHFTYETRVTNPAVTGQIMVSAARASMKMDPGAYTLLEIPLIHFLAGDPDLIIKRLL